MTPTDVKFCLEIANHHFTVNVLYQETKEYCKMFLAPDTTEDTIEIRILPKDIEKEQTDFKKNITEKQGEIFALHRKITEALIMHNVILFHGSAISVDGNGIIFTAPSGTGKSTHAEKWHRLFGAEYVNDDKPYISIGETATAFGSPWMGVYNRGNNTHSNINAICVIERANDCTVEKIPQNEAFSCLINQTYMPKRADLMRKTLNLVFALSKKVSLYRLRCNLDDECAIIAKKQMKI